MILRVHWAKKMHKKTAAEYQDVNGIIAIINDRATQIIIRICHRNIFNLDFMFMFHVCK
jgi:hypothetical protein